MSEQDDFERVRKEYKQLRAQIREAAIFQILIVSGVMFWLLCIFAGILQVADWIQGR